jgi:hypothetical protein
VRVVALAQRAPTTVPGDLSCCTRALGSQQFPSEGLVSRRCRTGGASARPPREQHSALSQAEASASFAWVAAAPEHSRPDLRCGQPVRLLPVSPPAPPSSAPSGLHPLFRTPLLRPAHVPLRAFVSLRRIVGTCCRSRGGGAAAASTCRWVASRPAAVPPPAPPPCPFSLFVHRAGTHLSLSCLSLSPDPSVSRPVFVSASSVALTLVFVKWSRRTSQVSVLSSRRTFRFGRAVVPAQV